MQWNIRGFYSRRPFLSSAIESLNPDIICVQETFLKPSKKAQLKGYQPPARTDRLEGDGGGVAIFIKNSLPYIETNIDTQLEAKTVTVYLENMPLTICTMYLPPKQENTTLNTRLTRLTQHLPKPFIIFMDSNAHHASWGSERTDYRGNIIDTWISESELCLLNTDEPTFISSSGNYSHIDLTIATPDIADMFNWAPHHSTITSDHFPIIIKSTLNMPSENEITRWCTRDANWSNFQDKVCIPTKYQNPTQACHAVTTAITTAAKETIKTYSTTPKIGGAKCWWTRDCSVAHKEKNRLLSFYKNHRGDIAAWCAYKRSQAIFRQIVIKAQRDSWSNYLHSLNSDASSAELWRLVKRMNGTYIRRPIILKENTNIITDPHQTANLLAEHFASKSNDIPHDTSFYEHSKREELIPIIFENEYAWYNSPITLPELHAALHCSKSKTPGPDGIPFSFLQNLTETQLTHLLHFYNYIYDNGFPEQWHEAIIIPLLKPGKVATSTSSYRPIALTNCLCKTLEKIINWRLQGELEKSNFYDPCQSGFRAGHSTLDPLCRIENDIRDSILQGKHCLAIFLDIKGAFDTVWHHGLNVKMKSAGLKGKMARFLQYFLQDRKIYVQVKGRKSDPFSLQRGVPQGSVVSPTLFSLMINDLFKEMPEGVQHSLFADDGSIWLVGKDLAATAANLQQAVTKIEQWTHTWGLEIAIEKTKCMLFTNCRLKNPIIKLNEQQIEYVTNFKFLGITLDTRLTWKHHIKQIQTRCNKDLTLMRVISSRGWGANRDTLTTLYKGLILPKVDYASFLYQDAAYTHLQILDRIQYSAARIITGAMRCTPVARLEAEACLMPLKHRRNLQLTKYCCRVLSIPDHPIRDLLLHERQYYNLLSNPSNIKAPFLTRAKNELSKVNINIPDFITITQANKYLFNVLPIGATLSEHHKSAFTPEQWTQLYNDMLDQHSNRIAIFTDGSSREEKSGSAMWSSTFKLLSRLPDYTNVFTCELYAIFCALKFVQHLPGQYILLTDSLSALRAIQNVRKSKNYIAHWIADLLKQYTNNKIILEWVPSHKGIPGNTEADSLAKEALSLKYITNISPTHEHLYKKAGKHYCEEWQREWATQPKCLNRFLKNLEPGSAQDIPRRQQISISRLRLDTTRLSHGHYATGGPAKKCPSCKTKMTHSHLLIECPKLTRERCVLFDICKGLSLPPTQESLLNKNFPHKELIKYLEAAGVLDEI